MFATFTWRIRRRVAAAALAAALLPVVTGCSSGSGTADIVAVVPASPSSSVAVSDAPGLPVVLRFGDHAVAATLADTPASRDFAATLPVTLVLSDAWGRRSPGDYRTRYKSRGLHES